MFWIVVLVAGAVIFYKVGDTDFDGRGGLFAGVSVIISLAAHFGLGWNMLGLALTQVGLFIAVTIYKMYSPSYRPRT